MEHYLFFLVLLKSGTYTFVKERTILDVTLVAPGEGICPELSLASTFIMLYRGSSLHLHRFCFFIGWTFISFLICSVVLSEEHTEITNVKKK